MQASRWLGPLELLGPFPELTSLPPSSTGQALLSRSQEYIFGNEVTIVKHICFQTAVLFLKQWGCAGRRQKQERLPEIKGPLRWLRSPPRCGQWDTSAGSTSTPHLPAASLIIPVGEKGTEGKCPGLSRDDHAFQHQKRQRHKLPLKAELRLTSPLRLTSFSSLIMPCTGAAIKTWLHPFTLVSWPFGQHEIRDTPHFLTVSDWDICWPPLAIHKLMLAPQTSQVNYNGGQSLKRWLNQSDAICVTGALRERE